MIMTASGDGGWTVVSDESPIKVVFDEIGDVFIGTFEGSQELKSKDDQPFTMWLFRHEGDLYGIQDSHKLRIGLSQVEKGREVRIEYVKDVEVGRPQPMKDFRISVR